MWWPSTQHSTTHHCHHCCRRHIVVFFCIFAQSRTFIAFTQDFNENETRTTKTEKWRNFYHFFFNCHNSNDILRLYILICVVKFVSALTASSIMTKEDEYKTTLTQMNEFSCILTDNLCLEYTLRFPIHSLKIKRLRGNGFDNK